MNKQDGFLVQIGFQFNLKARLDTFGAGMNLHPTERQNSLGFTDIRIITKAHAQVSAAKEVVSFPTLRIGCQPIHRPHQRLRNPPKTVYAELMEFGLVILFGIGVAWMYLTTPEQRQMIFGYIIFFTVIMSIIAFFTGQGPSSAYGPYF